MAQNCWQRSGLCIAAAAAASSTAAAAAVVAVDMYVLQVTEVPPFSAEANAVLDKLAAEFSVDDALQVKCGSREACGVQGFGLAA